MTLDVEVQEGRHWKIFAQVVANTRGRFHYSYRFHATEEPTTYTFRVTLPDTGAQGYPYTHGAEQHGRGARRPVIGRLGSSGVMQSQCG